MNKKIIIGIIVFFITHTGFVFASGRIEEAQFTGAPSIKYMSPAITDGNLDVLEVDFSKDIVLQKNRYLTQWSFEVYDSYNNLVFSNIVDVDKKQKTTSVPAFTYVGIDNDKKMLPDGKYVYLITTVDDKGNKSSSPPYTLIIDNTAPVIMNVNFKGSNVIVPYTEHSATFVINGQSDLTSQTTWQVVVKKNDEEGIIFSDAKMSTEAPEQEIIWVGQDVDGRVLEDGVYTVTARAFDEAGNRTTYILDTAAIISTEGIVFLKQPEMNAFSPNGDGLQDNILLELGGDTNVMSTFVSSEIVVFEKNRKGLWLERSRKKVSEFFPSNFPVFDGTDSSGSLLKDGQYKVLLNLITNENLVYATNKIDVVIDTVYPKVLFTFSTAPVAVPAKEDGPLFFGGADTPNLQGSFSVSETIKANIEVYKIDGNVLMKNTLPFNMALNIDEMQTEENDINANTDEVSEVDETSEMTDDMLNDKKGWLPINGELVYTQSLPSDMEIANKKNMLEIAPQILEQINLVDGLYQVVIVGSDLAGNPIEVLPVAVYRDTEEKKLEIITDKDMVSARKQDLVITLNGLSLVGLKKLLITIKNEKGNIVNAIESTRFVEGNGLPEFSWNARGDDGKAVADGMYYIEASVDYYNGANVSALKENIIVDSTPPSIDVFAPQGDVVNPKSEEVQNKTLTVKQGSEDTNVMWKAEIRDIFNKVVFSSEQETLSDFIWDGKDNSGLFLSDGDYFYLLTGTDEVGNSVRKTLAFIIDTGAYDEGKILTPNSVLPLIYFPGYSEDIFSVDGESLLYENLLNIRAIARMLKAYPKYTVSVIGHAAPLLLGTENAAEEQVAVLIPLSRQRASEVRNALMILGISEKRISIEAVGGLQPIVVDESDSNFWKNRRVEFVLKK